MLRGRVKHLGLRVDALHDRVVLQNVVHVHIGALRRRNGSSNGGSKQASVDGPRQPAYAHPVHRTAAKGACTRAAVTGHSRHCRHASRCVVVQGGGGAGRGAAAAPAVAFRPHRCSSGTPWLATASCSAHVEDNGLELLKGALHRRKAAGDVALGLVVMPPVIVRGPLMATTIIVAVAVLAVPAGALLVVVVALAVPILAALLLALAALLLLLPVGAALAAAAPARAAAAVLVVPVVVGHVGTLAPLQAALGHRASSGGQAGSADFAPSPAPVTYPPSRGVAFRRRVQCCVQVRSRLRRRFCCFCNGAGAGNPGTRRLDLLLLQCHESLLLLLQRYHLMMLQHGQLLLLPLLISTVAKAASPLLLLVAPTTIRLLCLHAFRPVAPLLLRQDVLL